MSSQEAPNVVAEDIFSIKYSYMITIHSKTKKEVLQKVVEQKISATMKSVKLIVNGRYRTIKEVAAAIGVSMPQRKSFLFLDKRKTVALCCIYAKGNVKWDNVFEDNGCTLKETNKAEKSLVTFYKRTCCSPNYSVFMRRLLFVYENGYFRYAGMYRVAAIDFDNKTVVMKKDPEIEVKFKVTTRKTVTVINEETSIEISI